MLLSYSAALLSLATAAFSKILYAGINEVSSISTSAIVLLIANASKSGGEFGVWSPGNKGFGLPGRFGQDYAFINKVSR